MSDRRRYGSLLCPDCGHHLHRPNPGICQWYDCGCPAEAAAPAGLDVEALARAFHELASHGGPLTPCGYVGADGEYHRVAYGENPPEDEFACLCNAIANGIAAEYDHLRQGKRE